MADAQKQTVPVTMRQLLEAGVHFGHQTQRWNPKMRPFIFGARNGIHIIDLQQTVPMFKTAYDFVLKSVAQGGSALFVGTKKQAQEIIAEEVTRAGQFHVTHRWLGGTLTNFKTMKISIERLKTIELMASDGTYDRLPKKEVAKLEREREKLVRNVGGIKDMGRVPGVIIVVDPKKEQIAVKEANTLGIPVVAIADTNCDPDQLTYVVPGNDDAIRSIRLFVARLADACVEGAAAHQANLRSRKSDESTDEVAEKPRGGKIPGGPEVQVIRRATPADEAEAPAAEEATAEQAAVEAAPEAAAEEAPAAEEAATETAEEPVAAASEG